MRIGTRAVLSRWVAPLWPVTLLAMVIGAAVGALVMQEPRTSTAAAVIRLDPPVDPNEIMTKQQRFPDVTPDFLAIQMEYLNSDGFLNAVGSRLQLSARPTLLAQQDGKTNLVTLTGIADDADDARKVVEAGIATYAEHIKKINDERAFQSLDAMGHVIDRLEGDMKLRGQPLTDPGDDLVALYLQRTSLQVELARPAGVVVAEPVAEQIPAGKLSMPALGATIGGFGAGIIALTCAQLWRTQTEIVTETDLVEDARLLRPIVPLSRGSIEPSTARTLYAQLSSGEPGRILVIGASAGSGTATVARYLAFAARESGPVVTDNAFEPHAAGNGETPGSATTISDGGDLGGSPSLISFAENADHIVVVARIGFDNREELRTAIRAMATQGVPVSVVYSRGRPRSVEGEASIAETGSTVGVGSART